MQQIRALTFDLDDTLWPVLPVITAAEQRAYDWLVENFPAVTARYDQNRLRDLRVQVATSHPELAHDMTRLRARSLHIAFSDAGLSGAGVDAAMNVFLEARNAVQPYPDCEPGLERLAQHFPLVAISNGNADISRTPMARFFSNAISAADAGCAKPDARIFKMATERLELAAGQVLHIGDHPEQDILGARNAGMKTMWMCRNNEEWPHQLKPDYSVSNLDQAVELLLGE